MDIFPNIRQERRRGLSCSDSSEQRDETGRTKQCASITGPSAEPRGEGTAPTARTFLPSINLSFRAGPAGKLPS